MMSGKSKILVSWSSGKDSAWMLHVLQQSGEYDIAGLVTTFSEDGGCVSAHGIRRELVERQVEHLGLPLISVDLPLPRSNAIYKERLNAVYDKAQAEGVTAVAFGDLFLEDIRAFRAEHMKEIGLEPLFPIFVGPDGTAALAQDMLDAGFQTKIICVNPKRMDPKFIGRDWDRQLLAELPDDVDPCGENGEFPTFCYDGPIFKTAMELEVEAGEERDDYFFADLILI